MKQSFYLLIGLLLPLFSVAQLEDKFDESLAPFYFGVASGDPLQDAVIIWTHLSTDAPSADLEWIVATDPELQNIVQSGNTSTDASRDYTVKVDVQGLNPGTYYYYAFRYQGQYSLIGRTKTAPSGGSDQLKFALLSCSSFHWGYFNIYDRIADRNDLDAVLHVGDYIYEYAVGTYSDPTLPERAEVPVTEIVSLDDYRTRYQQYRLDADLRRAHQQHPFIVTWDDHEIANDTWVNGAENHDPSEGDFQERKRVATQAYFEWLPIRENAEQTVYRSFKYGDLAEIFVLDTRHEARTEQISSILDPTYNDPRTLLGAEQKNWLLEGLKNSDAQWKIVAQQVMFAPFNVGFAAGDITSTAEVVAVENFFIDIWDGYPNEREEIISYLSDNQIDDVVILSGDIHTSFANDVTAQPVQYPIEAFSNLPVPSPTYNPLTGEGSAAVEFITPSVSSANFDENIGAATTAQFEFAMNNNLELPPGSGNMFNYNPHIKFNDLDRNGYVIVDLDQNRAQGDFHYATTVRSPTKEEYFETAFFTAKGDNHLQAAAAESPAKPFQASPAPATPPPFLARVQLIHNAPTQTVAVRVNGQMVLPTFAYQTATPYLDLPAGEELDIELVPIGGPIAASEVVRFDNLVFADGEKYVVVAYGTFDPTDNEEVQLSIFDQAVEKTADNRVAIQFFHGSPDAPEVDILSGQDNIFDNTGYGSFAPAFVDVPPLTYALDITPANDNNQVIATYQASLEWWKGNSAVIFATGNLNDDSFQPWVALSNGGTYPLPTVSFTSVKSKKPETKTNLAFYPSSFDLMPNPARQNMELVFTLFKDQQVDLQIISINGQTIYSEQLGLLPKGPQRHSISLDDLPVGNYLVRLNMPAGQLSKMFSKVE